MTVSTGESGKRSDVHVERSSGNTSTGESVPRKTAFSAAELATMNLPGLPRTKARIIDRATSEGWSYAEVKGLGGTKRVYEVPEHYLALYKPVGTLQEAKPQVIVVEGPEEAAAMQKQLGPGAVTIVSGGKANTELLALAVQAVEEWCQETGRSLPPGRKSAVIAVLYDYLVKGGGQAEVKTLLQAVG